MLYGDQLEEKTKNRLKKLRKKHGWTQETVVEAINNKYSDRYNAGDGSDILSLGTIKQYEAQSGKCSGMSIDTLCLLADLYGVSAEYLLGISDLETPDIDIKGINKKLGLTEEAIKKQLRFPFDQELLSMIIESKYYVSLMIRVHNFLMNRPIHENVSRKAKQEREKYANSPYRNDEMIHVDIDEFEREKYAITKQFDALLDDLYKEKSSEYLDERTDHDDFFYLEKMIGAGVHLTEEDLRINEKAYEGMKKGESIPLRDFILPETLQKINQWKCKHREKSGSRAHLSIKDGHFVRLD